LYTYIKIEEWNLLQLFFLEQLRRGEGEEGEWWKG
jgi:hypothetical protein